MTPKELRAKILWQIDSHRGQGEWSEKDDLEVIADDLGDVGDLVRHLVVKEYQSLIRARAPKNDGQTVLFDDSAVLNSGEGMHTLMPDVSADIFDRANAVRARNYAGQARAAAAWATFYSENAPILRETGGTLGDIFANEDQEETG